MSDGSPEPDGWVCEVEGGSVVRVHASPGASRSAITGFHGSALRVRVGARPVDGAANRALLAVLAQVLGLPASAVSIETGATGREKRVRIAGLAPDAVRARIRAVLCVDRARRHN